MVNNAAYFNIRTYSATDDHYFNKIIFFVINLPPFVNRYK